MTCGFEFKEIEEEGDPSQGRYSGQSVGAAVRPPPPPPPFQP